MKLLSAVSSFLLLTGAIAQDCPSVLTNSITLSTKVGDILTFKYDVVLSSFSDNTSLLCAQLQSDAGGYIVFGTSPSASMADGEAVIGIPGDAEDDPGTVRKYNLNVDSPRTVLMPNEQQTLMDTQITTENGNTIMMFSKLLRESGERTILANGENMFLWALGGGSDLSYFPDDEVGSFGLDFGITRPPTSSAITPLPTSGRFDLPEAMVRTLSPTGGHIRRDDPPAPTPGTVMPDGSPSDAAGPDTPASDTTTTDKSAQNTATPDSLDSPSGTITRKTIGNAMMYGSGVIALWLM